MTSARILALFLLAACGSADDTSGADTGLADSGDALLLEPGFDAGLSQHIGCTDTWVQVWDPEVGVAIEIYAPDLVSDAGGSSHTRTVDLSDLGAHTVRAVVADPIADNYCTDGLVEREVHETWEAVSGSLTLVVTPGSGTEDPTADLSLTDAVFALGGAERTVSSASFADITLITMWGG